jgi:hypothetical protein
MGYQKKSKKKLTRGRKPQFIRIVNETNNRYYDSTKNIDYVLTEINSDGLMKLVGTYKGIRTFRYFYKKVPRREMRELINENKRDILREIISSLNERAVA